VKINKFSLVLSFLASFNFLICNVASEGSDKYYVSLARECKDKGDRRQAIKYYEVALKVNPDNIQANYDLGIEYYCLREYEKARDIFERLSIQFPNDYSVVLIEARVYQGLGSIYKAIENYKKVIQLKPDCKMAYKELGYCYFMMGDYKKGLDYQYKIGMDGKGRTDAGYQDKLWDGKKSLVNKVILLRDEGGFGDMFQWIRFGEFVKKREAYVVVEARRNIIPLLSNCPYIDKLIEKGTKYDQFDYHIFAGGIWRACKLGLDNMPKNIPYLYADEILIRKWKKKLSQDDKFKIGICWDPQLYRDLNTGKVLENNRAIPLSIFYSLGKLENVSLYSLQQRNGLEQLDTMPEDFKIHTFNNAFDRTYGSFMDTAAVMKNIDLVITADTSIAHLAGALGVKVWVMLPFSHDWRWMKDKRHSPLYPTMRLFRQKRNDDWGSVMKEVEAELFHIIN